MINHIASGKLIVPISNNNQKAVKQFITIGDYTHVFTNQEMTLSKKFKLHIHDNRCFTN